MIRLAKSEDIPLVVHMAEEFFQNSRYKGVVSFSPEKAEQLCRKAVEGPEDEGVIFLHLGQNNEPTGFLGALRGYLPFSDDPIGLEVSMYVSPDHRKGRAFQELFSVFEYWCQEVAKVKFIQVSTLEDNPILDKFYQKKGYVKSESAYLKVV